jgi:hypothetical protein
MRREQNIVNKPALTDARRRKVPNQEPAAKPVSLAPLSFEEALGGLLEVKRKKLPASRNLVGSPAN